MNILAFSNATGSVRWRLQNVANYINNRTNHEMYVTSHRNWDGDILHADLVIAQMWRNPEGIKACKEQGAKVIYEADDIVIGVGGKDRSKLMALTKAQEKQTAETIGLCDAVTVTTEVLASHYKQYNKNVFILPNYMDFLWWGKPPEVERYSQQIRLGWAGSYSHHEDLIMIAPIIKRIIDEYPFVKFIYCGHGGMGGGFGKNIEFGQDIFKDIPFERREFYPGVGVEYWPQKFKTLALDIGIAPLLNDEFNAGKSCLKYLEYSANGIPAVYSDTVVYNKSVQHGKTGFLASTPEQWYLYLSKLILTEQIRKAIAKDAFMDVWDHWNLDDHFIDWVRIYERTSGCSCIKIRD
jgi:glycosyltransferase involved in cell wall biosynthesis